MPNEIIKYPRTQHVEGSRLQPGDEDLSQVAFSSLGDKYIVVEEKVDGANSGLSFGPNGTMYLQSRGHFLVGGPRERHFAQFKTWAAAHQGWLWDVLGPRYIMFGEWMYAKHTVFYDRLPHYFMEFDVYDKEAGTFFSTEMRRMLFEGRPIQSVPVLWEGPASDLGLDGLKALVQPSLYKSERWVKTLREAALAVSEDPDKTVKHTDPEHNAEGLYIKIEDQGLTVDRLKWVRWSFMTSIMNQEQHWLERTIIPNQLAEGVDLYAW